MGVGNSNTTRSLGTNGSDIYTPSFCAEQSPVNITLPDSVSKSVLFANRVSFGFATHVGYKHTNPEDRANDFVYDPIIRMVDGEPIVHLRTGSSNENKFHASGLFDNGAFSPVYLPWDDLGIQKWRDVCEGDKAISYSVPEKEGILIEGPERLASFDSGSTQLPKFVKEVIDYKGPTNKFGFYLSKNENFRQDLRNILFDKDHKTRYDEDAVNFTQFLSEKYGTPRHIIGIGAEKTDVVAKIIYDDKHSYLIGSTDFYEKAKSMAESYGLKGSKATEFVKKAVIYHELTHNSQPRMSEKDAESDVGETLDGYFTKKAKSLEGTEEGRIYKALAKNEKKYAERWKSGKGRNTKSKSRNLESKIKALESEARSLGLEDGEAREYITDRLKDTTNEDYSRESNLERDIDKEYERETGERSYNKERDSDEYFYDGKPDENEASERDREADEDADATDESED